MHNTIFEDLYTQGLLGDKSIGKVRKYQEGPVHSLFWDLRTLLYLGIAMLSTGMGLLIYKNIDSIGHQVILLFIAALTAGCFYWCNKNKFPFSAERVESPDAFFDYVVLLGTLSFLTFTGYLQYQYQVFGNRYGLATFIPMLVLFFIAYYFDHRGILSLAIANLAVWMGVTVTPKELLESVDFDNEIFIYTYLAFGCILLLAAYLSAELNFKKHFLFSYHHYGIHVTFIALLSGYFHYDYAVSLIWLVVLLALAVFVYKHSFKNKSFYFLMIAVLYAYTAAGGFVVRSAIQTQAFELMYLVFMYFIGSGIGLIVYLISVNKRIKEQ
jgi:hypothetical protein